MENKQITRDYWIFISPNIERAFDPIAELQLRLNNGVKLVSANKVDFISPEVHKITTHLIFKINATTAG